MPSDYLRRLFDIPDRRINEEIEKDEVHWDDLMKELVDVMVLSEMPDSSLITATLHALLGVLTASSTSIDDAKNVIKARLDVFRE